MLLKIPLSLWCLKYLLILYSKKVIFFLYNSYESDFLKKKKDDNLKRLRTARSFLKALSTQISVIILKWSM